MSALLSNATSNLVLMMLHLGITFIMTPLYVRYLGDYDYGVWELAMVVFGYLGLLDLGIRQALIVFSSRFLASNDKAQMQQLYATGLAAFIVIGLVGSIAWLGWSALWFDPVVSEEGAGRYTIFSFLIAANFVVAMPGLVSLSLIEGNQLFKLRNIIQAGLASFGAITAYLLMPVYDPLIVLSGIAIAGSLIRLSVLEVAIRRLKIIGRRLQVSTNAKMLRGVARFGAKSFAQGSALQIEAGLPILLIGAIADPALIIFFAIPNALFRHTQNVVRSIAEVFMPEFSRLNSLGEKIRVQQLFLLSSKVLLLIAGLLLAGIASVGALFIDSWIEPRFGTENRVLISSLAIYHFLTLINPMVVRYLTAIDSHGFLAKARVVKLFVLVIVIVPAMYGFGLLGLVGTLIVSECAFFPIMLNYACRQLQVKIYNYCRVCLVPIIVPAAALLLTGSILVRFLDLDSIVKVLTAAVFLACVYTGVAWLFSLNYSEKQQVLGVLRSRSSSAR